MPVYAYRCPKCHAELELSRSIANRDDPLMCDCGGVMRRKVGTLAAFKFAGNEQQKDSDK